VVNNQDKDKGMVEMEVRLIFLASRPGSSLSMVEVKKGYAGTGILSVSFGQSSVVFWILLSRRIVTRKGGGGNV
jgi:hypothetical protein